MSSSRGQVRSVSARRYGVAVFISCWLFFFQAEDGIRDTSVTGVQTCALPIWRVHVRERPFVRRKLPARVHVPLAREEDELLLGEGRVDARERDHVEGEVPGGVPRSEERRVGKECGSRGWGCQGREKGRRHVRV